MVFQSRLAAAYRLRVHHPPWPLSLARVERLSTTLLSAAGLAVGDPIDLALSSDAGVAVQTFAREDLGIG